MVEDIINYVSSNWVAWVFAAGYAVLIAMLKKERTQNKALREGVQALLRQEIIDFCLRHEDRGSAPVWAKQAEAAQDFDKSLAGTYKVTASALNIRAGAGTGKKSLGTIPNGKTVQCYGYYTKVGSVKWLYVTYNSITGFCSSEYLA